MDKGIRLSHSASQKYIECPQKWKLHYRDNLRSTKLYSSLFFGSSLDDALGRICLEKKKTLTEAEKLLMNSNEFTTFDSSFKMVYTNGEYVDVSTSELAEYFKSDYTFELLEGQDFSNIAEFAKELEFDIKTSEEIEQFIEEVHQMMKNKVDLDKDTKRLKNYIYWLSLSRKGHLMLKEYRIQILPLIDEVFSIQKQVSLPDGKDEFIGYIDLICSFKDEKEVQYVTDHKTSSRPYKDDSVLDSAQLAAYSEYEENRKCAFIVLNKNVYKKEPFIRTQVIRGTIPESKVDEAFDNITEVMYNIKEEKFEKNFDDKCYSYGRPCEFYSYCRTGDLKNLVYSEKK